jgi:hypothetical protein
LGVKPNDWFWKFENDVAESDALEAVIDHTLNIAGSPG